MIMIPLFLRDTAAKNFTTVKKEAIWGGPCTSREVSSSSRNDEEG